MEAAGSYRRGVGHNRYHTDRVIFFPPLRFFAALTALSSATAVSFGDTNSRSLRMIGETATPRVEVSARVIDLEVITRRRFGCFGLPSSSSRSVALSRRVRRNVAALALAWAVIRSDDIVLFRETAVSR